MDTDLETLATALYVRVDDLLKDRPELVPPRPRIGLRPKLSDAELITMAVLQVLLGFDDEARWVRHAKAHLGHLFPYVPGQAGYNKRLRKAASTCQAVMRLLAKDVDAWADDTWLIDSTPVECGRSRPTAKRSNLAGWDGYGYCASHSRYFWGLRLHLVATPPVCPWRSRWPTPRPTNERSPSTCSTATPSCSPGGQDRPLSLTRVTRPRSSSGAWPTSASSSSDPP